MRSSDEEVFGTFTAGQGCMVGGVSLPFVLGLLIWLGDGQGHAAAVALGGLVLTPFLFSPLRRRAWFWVALGLMAAAQAAAVLFFPWPEVQLSGVELGPLIWANIIFVGGFIWLLNKVMARRQP